MTEDAGAQDARHAEDAREQEWAAFIQAVKDYQRGIRWSTVLADVADAMDGYKGYRESDFHELCINFAEGEGWDGVLRAVARAIADERKA